ncbi:MAG: response regulator transcription factor [Cytophagaceae bacterium]|nr:response regulator transcription factor [Cytophagaceae bacterium]
MKILVIDDEQELLNSISNYLDKDQFLYEYALDLKSARLRLSVGGFNCFIVDTDLSGGSGLDLVKEIRKQNPDAFIIIISAKHSTEDKVEGLNSGADDYLSKPIALPELQARLHAVLRHYKPSINAPIEVNEIRVQADTYQVFVHNLEVALTKKEYDLLLFFITNKNRIISKLAIVEHLWSNYQDFNESYDFLYAQIKNLRKKLTTAGCTDYIQNINRIGYKFRTN